MIAQQIPVMTISTHVKYSGIHISWPRQRAETDVYYF